MCTWPHSAVLPNPACRAATLPIRELIALKCCGSTTPSMPPAAGIDHQRGIFYLLPLVTTVTAPYDKAGIAAQRILFEGNLYIRELLFQHVCAVCTE